VLNNFRKIRIGFINLTLEHLEKDDKEEAKKYADDVKIYLKNVLNIDLIEYESPVFQIGRARKAWKYLQSNDVDAVILFNGTFNTADLAVEIVRNLETQYLLWGLEEFGIPRRNFAGSMVAMVAQGAVLKNMDKAFSFVYGDINDKAIQNKARVFINTVRAITYLREANIGIIGMRPDGFEVAGYDELAIKKLFGTTLRNIPFSGLMNDIKNVSNKDVNSDMEIQKDIFNINKTDIEEAKGLSRAYLAIKKTIEKNDLQSYAIDCWPELRDNNLTPVCPANGRFNTEGIMAACEADIDGSLTLMTQYAMTGNTPWFADFVNLIKEYDSILFWHCGNAPYTLSKSKPIIEPVVKGLSQTSALKDGIVTVCRLNSIRGKFTLHAAVGEAKDSKPLMRGSNILVKMNCGNKEYIDSLIENGIPHHNGIVYGNILSELEEFAKLLGIPSVILK